MNFKCTVSSWSDSSVTCTHEPLPAGTWQVRAFVPNFGWATGTELTMAVAPSVVTVEDAGLDKISSSDAMASLIGGQAGGVELTLNGSHLGLNAAQTRVTVSGLPCVVTESGVSQTKCVTRPLTTPEMVEMFEESFKFENLAGAVDASFFSDRGSSSIESTQAYAMMIGNREDQMLNMNYGGALRMRNHGESCYFGFELPAGKEAMVHEAAVHTPIHPDRRKRVRTSKLQVKMHADAEWTDVFKFEEIEVEGHTIAQGWTAFKVDPPVRAQQFRAVLLPDGCVFSDGVAAYPSEYRTELPRAVRFNGILLDSAPLLGPIVLTRVRHPVAKSAWEGSLQVGQLVHDLNRTATLTCPTWPNHGTARGGTVVRLCGENLAPIVNGGEMLTGELAAPYVKVWLNGYECQVTEANETGIECVTSPRVRGITPASTRVAVAGRGYAMISGNIEEKHFQYIDAWSDPLSWVKSDAPVDGDSVVVAPGQAILLDKDSPRLFLLLIQGIMEFDRRDLTLEATYIWVAGGHLKIGTEERPFLHNAMIQMYGDRWNTIELPFIGSKMIAVTNRGGLGGGCHGGGTTRSFGSGEVPTNCRVQSVGKLDFHGRPDTSWTRLVRTAPVGATMLFLAEPVNWPEGSQIVITPSHRGHQEEVRHVAGVSDGGYTVIVDKPLRHEHLGTWYWHPNISGPTDLRAAVGLQTKNILIRANASALYGRNNDFLFGVAVHTFFGGEMRIENVEFTRTGQAANFGRYSSHWHNLAPGRNVDVVGKAYLRNNSYHDTFQRCVVVHGTDHAVVRDNVGHKAHGHCFFTEAGDEDYTLMEHNLAVHPLKHYLLLNDDTDPAGFWLPGFTGWHRHNLAANCHRGWRVRQTGPAQTGLTFFNNSAHACGFGWHLKPPHAPPTLNYFKTFTAFRCNMGMFYYGTGNIVHEDHRFIECGTGHLNNHLFNGLHTAPFYFDSYVVGNIDQDLDNVGAGQFDGDPFQAATGGTTWNILPGRRLATQSCRSRSGLGYRWAKDGENMIVSGITAINMCNSPVFIGCFKIACTMRVERFKAIHSYKHTHSYSWKSGIYWDLDGSLTGWPNGFVTWNTAFNHYPGLCKWGDIRHSNGVYCGSDDGKVRLRRVRVSNAEPWQLRGANLRIISAAGQDIVKYDWMFMCWYVPLVSYMNTTGMYDKNGTRQQCTEDNEPLEYDIWPEKWNTFQRLKFEWSSQSSYVWQAHGYNHWEKGYFRSYTTPTSEGIRLKLNFTHDWRDHFDVDASRSTRLRERPSMCAGHPTGAHSMRLWEKDCNKYNWSSWPSANDTGALELVPGHKCSRTPAAVCAGPHDFCYYDEACGSATPPAECNAGGVDPMCRACGGSYGLCPYTAYNASFSRGACTGGYTDFTTLPLRLKLNKEPLIDQVGGQFSSLLYAGITGNRDRFGSGQNYRPANGDWNLGIQVRAKLCPPEGCPKPPPAPTPPPSVPVRSWKRWSDPATWGGSVPKHMDDVGINFNACFDPAASMPDDGSFTLNWVVVVPGAVLDLGGNCLNSGGRRLSSTPRHLRINVRSLIVWGTLELGTPEQPVPAIDSVTVAFYGGLFSHTVVVTEGLFVRNKVMVVMGELIAHGTEVGGKRRLAESVLGPVSESDKAWKRLSITAPQGASEVTVRGDASSWPVGKSIGLSPTEYPKPPTETETEVSTIVAVAYDPTTDTTVIKIADKLNYSHFAGVVATKATMGGHWERVELTAYATLLEGRSNIVFTTGESDDELLKMSTDFSLGYGESVGHGGTLVIGGDLNGELFGSANLHTVDFIRMGKRNLEHPAIWFYYLGGFNKGDPTKGSKVENCVFSHNMAGGLEVTGVGRAPLSIVGNIFHSTFRFGIWLVGPFRIASGRTRPSQKGDRPICKDDHIVVRNNFVMDNIRSPHDDPDFGVELWYRPFASFIMEVRPVDFLGNIAAGATDIGFALRPPTVNCLAPWEPPIEAPVNEAVGCLIGFFYLRAKGTPKGHCASIHGVAAWMNAHMGITTIDQGVSLRIGQVLVSDNHVGILLNFAAIEGGKYSMNHRVYGHNVTLFGSTPASSCERSYDCRSADQYGTSCNDVFGSNYRRLGLVSHMVTGKGKTCELQGMGEICDMPHQWFKMCVGPWETRRGSIGARYSEAHWDKLTVGYFKKKECANHPNQRSYAIATNPSSIDFSWPNHFSDVKYLPSADRDAIFYLEANGREDDGIWQYAITDVDGSLIGGAPPNSSVIAAANGGIARGTCTQVGHSIQCANGDPHLTLNKLTWEPVNAVDIRTLGLMKLLRTSDDRATASSGPVKNMCPMDIPYASRSWMVAPNEEYNITLFASPPKNHNFYYFNDRPECIQINLRLSQPFRLDVYIGNTKLDEDAFDTARNSPTPRLPKLGDPKGSAPTRKLTAMRCIACARASCMHRCICAKQASYATHRHAYASYAGL
eukprot:TRINITY_DN11337_c0_g2_i2.p1 TRINITY_DN11337_c0_g2~~TRINITY_DN11337_c0_g2_i2.p1  ORF type:complete len:2654 (+),score=461.77 TRINITY_DN11337_c0_g2_i2:695-7963(+)